MIQKSADYTYPPQQLFAECAQHLACAEQSEARREEKQKVPQSMDLVTSLKSGNPSYSSIESHEYQDGTDAVKPSVFYLRRQRHSYVYLDQPTDLVDGTKNLLFPVEVDTEYTHPETDINEPDDPTPLTTTITAQIRAITLEGTIFAHPDIREQARHRVFESGFVAVDYLQRLGYNVRLERVANRQQLKGLNSIEFDIYAFFPVADIARLVTGEFQRDILDLCSGRSGKSSFEHTRRLEAQTKINGRTTDWVEMPWRLWLNGHPYSVKLSIFDTAPLHGDASYKELCLNTGVKLDAKDVFTDEEKSRMLAMYHERPDEFDAYALGDLHNYDALMGNKNNMQEVYRSLGLEEYFVPPKLTMGSTVCDLLKAMIAKEFGLNDLDNKFSEQFLDKATSKYFMSMTTRTAALNAKVSGGRCRNNRPTDTTVAGLLVDIDVKGCYSDCLRVQLYPIGTPVVIHYPANSKHNAYLDLETFLKRYSRELVPGLWQARVSGTLKYPQDILFSWLPPKNISEMTTDTDVQGTDDWSAVDNDGETRIYTMEVHNALINHDFIQWLENVASKRQRRDMLKNLRVVTSVHYPASERVNTPQELIKSYETHTGENTSTVSKRRGKTIKTDVEEECHKWYAINLGNVLVTPLAKERRKYDTKEPLNKLYKLIINTLYGDMASKYFTVANVVVGNNITARARTFTWCMEKGLHVFQTVTDGGAFDLNHVPFLKDQRQRTFNGENMVALYRTERRDVCAFKPLGGYDEIRLTAWTHFGVDDAVAPIKKPTLELIKGTEITKLEPTEDCNSALGWINQAAMRHLQQLFPGLDVLHQITQDVHGNDRKGQFEFETKQLYERAVFHGSANYCLGDPEEGKIAMRSYDKKQLPICELQDKKIILVSTELPPAEAFFKALMNDPTAIVRGSIFIRPSILKVNDYREHYETKWRHSSIFPGCTYHHPGRLLEFNLNQFTYQTHKQEQAWRKEWKRLKNRYGQSYEMFFTNPDGTLNYQEMVETIAELIESGSMDLHNGRIDKNRNRSRNQSKHPNQTTLELVKKSLDRRYVKNNTSIALNNITTTFIRRQDDATAPSMGTHLSNPIYAVSRHLVS